MKDGDVLDRDINLSFNLSSTTSIDEIIQDRHL